MTNEQIELLNRIKDEVAKEFHGYNFENSIDLMTKPSVAVHMMDEVLRRYTSELEAEITRLKESRDKSIVATLEKAAERIDFQGDLVTDKSNIVIVE